MALKFVGVVDQNGANGTRSKSPGAFYPIYFNKAGRLSKLAMLCRLSKTQVQCLLAKD